MSSSTEFEGSVQLSGRATCYVCFRPAQLCYCKDVRRVANRTEIIVLQHPRESFHPIGTARIAALGLERVRVEVDTLARFREGAEPLVLPAGTGLLYPGASSRDLAELTPQERPRHLLVLDGTWHHARTLFRDVPGISQLPRFSFRPPNPSEYRLRREPHADYVSTIEAIAHCLRLLEPETPGVDGLLDVFRAMIERQVQARPAHRLKRSMHNARAKAVRVLPRVLAEQFARLVVVYGETMPLPGVDQNQLVHWTARRLADGASFEALIRPEHAPDPFVVECSGLQLSDLEQGWGPAELRARWEEFLTPDDVLAAWTQRALVPLTRITGSVPPGCISLKSAYHNLKRYPGSLEEVMRQEGLTPCENGFRGRGARRLGNAEALARFIHATSRS
jgi:DTW domain-containing protein